jgi:hypothetical protein
MGALALLEPPPAELGEDFFLRFLADRTGVEQEDVGLLCVFGLLDVERCLENVGHLRRVVFVHLTAKRLDEESLRHTN